MSNDKVSPRMQAILDGILLTKEVHVPFEPVDEQSPHFHPLTGERVSDPVLYAITDVLWWMGQFDAYKTSSDRLRLWYIRDYMDAMVVAAKGDFPLDMPEFKRGTVKGWEDWSRPPCREEQVLMYDGPIDSLWVVLDSEEAWAGLRQRMTVFVAAPEVRG